MRYDLVFEGGGAKGMVFVGAMQVFEAEGHEPGRLLGTSAGAITAALLAAGYSSDEMEAALAEQAEGGHSVFSTFMAPPTVINLDALMESDLGKFLRGFNIPVLPNFIEQPLENYILKRIARSDFGPNLYSLVEQGGWFTADNFLSWLKNKLDSGEYQGKPRNFSDMTLKEFYEATRVELSLVGSDTSAHQILVLNHRTAPDCPLVWAVRMSMSIPMVWPEVVWQKEWGHYQDVDITGDAIVDGGLLSNFPVELFLSTEPETLALMGPPQNTRVLGMLIDENKEVIGMPEDVMAKPKESKFDLMTIKRLLNLMDTMLQAHDKMVIDANKSLVVRLPAAGYGTTEFNMDEAKRTALVAAGNQTMREYFEEDKRREREREESGMALPFSFGPPGEELSLDVPGDVMQAREINNQVASNLLKFKRR